MVATHQLVPVWQTQMQPDVALPQRKMYLLCCGHHHIKWATIHTWARQVWEGYTWSNSTWFTPVGTAAQQVCSIHEQGMSGRATCAASAHVSSRPVLRHTKWTATADLSKACLVLLHKGVSLAAEAVLLAAAGRLLNACHGTQQTVAQLLSLLLAPAPIIQPCLGWIAALAV